MPELPEVEVVARALRPHLTGRLLRAVEVRDPKLRAMLPPEGLPAGARIEQVRRVGKQVVLELMPPTGVARYLVVHLRMTGRLIYTATEPAESVKYIRLVAELDRGWLVFQDTRRFGTMKLVEDWRDVAGGALDPLSRGFTPMRLEALLAGVSTPIKVWLMRQDRLVGMGNIYASESLFMARVHPARPGGTLKRAEIERLHSAIRKVLRKSILSGGTTFSDFRDGNGRMGNYAKRLRVYGHAGEPCPVCGTRLEKMTQAQRSTFYCPHCQR